MMMEKLEYFLNKFIGPIAQKSNNNHSLQAIAEGFVRTTPITIGIAAFAIIGNFPIPAWLSWLEEVGLKAHFDAVLNASTNALALYVVFSIAYCYSRRRKKEPITAGFLALLSFLIVIPQSVEGVDGVIQVFPLTYLGGNGILVGLTMALLVGHLYAWLNERGVKFKLPDSVPPNVSESLSPVFIAMIIVTVAFGIRVLFGYTPYGNFFDFISQTIGGWLLNVGLSLPSMFFVGFLANLLWFFGVHPNTINGPFAPLATTVVLANIADFQAGVELRYLTITLVVACSGFGGGGNTLGLCLDMFTAKSKRYKQMLKLSLIPNIFNINEPLIFGMPIMLNPLFFIPMVFTNVVLGLVGLFATKIFTFTYNPMMSLLPWTTPIFVKNLLAGGVSLLVMTFIVLFVNALMYYPFFKIADKKALEEEMALEAAKEKV